MADEQTNEERVPASFPKGDPNASSQAGPNEEKDMRAAPDDALLPGETAGPPDIGARAADGTVVPSKEQTTLGSVEDHTPADGEDKQPEPVQEDQAEQDPETEDEEN